MRVAEGSVFPARSGERRGTCQAPYLLLGGRGRGGALKQGTPIASEKEDHGECQALWWALGRRSIFPVGSYELHLQGDLPHWPT